MDRPQILDATEPDRLKSVFGSDDLIVLDYETSGLDSSDPDFYIAGAGHFSRGTTIRHLADNFGNGLSSFFPLWLRDSHSGSDGDGAHGNSGAWPPAPVARGIGSDTGAPRNRPNLSAVARRYLERLGLGVEDLFHYVLATLHDPAYREANAGALRMEWPRIPLPGWPASRTAGGLADFGSIYLAPTPAGVPPASPDRQTAEALARSAARGRELAALLDPDTPVPGVTTGRLRPEIASIAVPATTDGRNMTGQDFALTVGWGHVGTGGAVMPGQGRIVERAFTPDERTALSGTLPVIGEITFDIYLNDRAFWRNVPAAVWSYKLGGYQVLKKWLSSRERDILDRPLRSEEVRHFADIARRIAAISPALQWHQREGHV